MSIVRLGEIQAQPGKGAALLALLEKYFVPGIEASAGWQAYQILRRQDEPERITIVEVWESGEAHRASAQAIPPEALADVRALIAAPPSGAYYEIVRAKDAGGDP
jgi:quinol monooxygenase YgiN